jgi:hypothetical protein
LSEVHVHHSADLVGVLAGHADLGEESRKLLREAARVRVEGQRFDDELIGCAERLVSRAEVLVVGSMSRISCGTPTILAGWDREGERNDHAPVSAATRTRCELGERC